MWCNYCYKHFKSKYYLVHVHLEYCRQKQPCNKLLETLSCCLCWQTLTDTNIAISHPKFDICQECFDKENGHKEQQNK